MVIEELSQLRNIKGEPCISIIIPTGKAAADKETDQAIVNNAINKALHIFKKKYGEEKAEYFINKLNRLSAAMDFVNDSEGLGIFISKNIAKVVKFPFSVSEKVIVGDEFETRDLVYTTRSLFDYYFLLLSTKSSRLFKGFGEIITEVIDENFPREHVSEYEKVHHDGKENYKLSSNDVRASIDERSSRTFFMNVDYLLFLYLQKETPLFVAGAKENLEIFKHITKYGRNVSGFREGIYDSHNPEELDFVIKSELRKYISLGNEVIIKQFKELIGTDKVIWGIAEAWKTAAAGKTLTLLVEKDFICPAVLSPGGKNIYPAFEENIDKGAYLNDAVNDLINMVLNKGGDVIFTENEKLSAYDKIAVILRN